MHFSGSVSFSEHIAFNVEQHSLTESCVVALHHRFFSTADEELLWLDLLQYLENWKNS